MIPISHTVKNAKIIAKKYEEPYCNLKPKIEWESEVLPSPTTLLFKAHLDQFPDMQVKITCTLGQVCCASRTEKQTRRRVTWKPFLLNPAHL